MSGTQVSAWQTPNELLTSMETPALVQRNQLMNQEAQQTINSNEMEQASRAANWVLTQDDKPAAYSTALRLLKANGYAKNSPDQYPGDAAISYLARQGTSSAEQFKLGQAGTAIPTPGFSTGGTTPAAGGSGTAAAAPGTIEPEAVSRANAVRDGLMKRGLDYDTATAFAANALHESSANPNTGAGDAGASHGLFQWRGDRYDRYVAKYGHSPDNAPLDEQLDYVLDELNGPESLAKGRIAQAQGPEGKAGEVSQAFLRPKDVAAEMARRSATAKQLAALGPTPATPGTTDQQWLANQGRQYPSLASAGAGTPGQAPAAPGGQATPPPYQVAGSMQPPPTAATAPQNTLTPPLPPAATTAPPAAYATAPTKEAATAQAIATGKPVLIEGGQGAAALPSGRLVANLPDLPTAPPAQQTAQPPPQVKMPPAPDEMDGNHLTRQDYVDLDRAKRSGMGGPQLTQEVQQRQNANLIRQRQYQEDVRLAQNDAAARQDKAATQAREAEQLRLSQKSDARAEAEAKRAGLPAGYRLDDSGKAVRIDGLPPDTAVLEAQANAGRQAQRQFDQENTLRDEFQKLTGDFRIVQTSFENIRSAAKANDGAGDMSLLYNYVRLLDPTSVVRESEFAAAAASGSFGQRVQGAVERVLNGARMPETLRQSFIREGKNLYDNQLRSHDTVADQYEELARANGLEPKRVVTRFARSQEDTRPPLSSFEKP